MHKVGVAPNGQFVAYFMPVLLLLLCVITEK